MTARVTFRVAAAHPPPPRAPIARAKYILRLAFVRAKFKGGDLNLDRFAASKALRRRVVGSGVLWLTIPRNGWRVLEHRTVDVGSDHPAELITVKHIATGEVVAFLVINCASYSVGGRTAAMIMRAGIDLEPDVILGSECLDFRAVVIDRKGAYQWDQPGRLGSAESGVLVGVRNTRAAMTESHRRVGSKATREGDGIDERSIVRDRITLIDNREN